MTNAIPLDHVDKAFIEAVYELPEWSVRKIARKLNCDEEQVKTYAKYNGLKRPERAGYRIKSRTDWEAIWHLCVIEGRSFSEAGKIVGCSYQNASYAVKKMKEMTPEERQIKWSRFKEPEEMDDHEPILCNNPPPQPQARQAG